MRLIELKVENFRAISLFHITNLRDLIIIAGPNGCGKSCVFDAIRLLKSMYGGYHANEWMQWFGEFQIDPNDPKTFTSLFRDKMKPVSIIGSVELAHEELQYIDANAEAILEPLVWAEVTGQPADNYGFSSLGFAGQFPHFITTVSNLVTQRAAELRAALTLSSHTLSLTIPPGGRFTITDSLVARVVFQTYLPATLGVIDFHSAARTYAREGLGGINLDTRAIEGQRRSQTLYNWQAKYQNIKAELVTTYLRDMIAQQSGAALNGSKDLNETLKELFQTFFPEKTYLGVQPDSSGGISFPVVLSTGERHDLNDLSSGEKEVLYGYLRLRNSTPKHSTILIDEPELHLNPGLLRGFPDFYFRHVAQAHDNQVWLVTHSDTLLKQAVGNSMYSVYHMTHASAVASNENQVMPVAEDELQRAIMDLVGDVAAYRPYAKVVIFEGDSDKEFDVDFVIRLFPRIRDRANLISGGSKGRVQDLYKLLARTAGQVGLANRFYAITDRDFDTPVATPETAHILSWDVYHIENYLLSLPHLAEAIAQASPRHELVDEHELLGALKKSAEQCVNGLVVRHLQNVVNDRLIYSINIKGGPNAEPVESLLPSIQASVIRLRDATSEVIDPAYLQRIALEYRSELMVTLQDNRWLSDFPGRPILKRFVADNLGSLLSYEGFVNLIISRMVEAEYQPVGMKNILDQIIPGV